MQIKKIQIEDLPHIEQLISQEYETLFKHEFSEEGQAVFEEYINQNSIKKRVIDDKTPAFKAVIKDEIVGYIELKGKNRVSLFFVSSQYQKKGVGRALLSALEEQLDESVVDLEVHSSSVAVTAYEHLGFTKLSEPIIDWGIRYIPMEKRVKTSVK